MRSRHAIAALALFGALNAVHAVDVGPVDSGKSKAIEFTGTVRRQALEGGFFGIIADDGRRYDPLNLPKKFAVHGARVRIKAQVRHDIMTTRMWGTTIHIKKIQRAAPVEPAGTDPVGGKSSSPSRKTGRDAPQ